MNITRPINEQHYITFIYLKQHFDSSISQLKALMYRMSDTQLKYQHSHNYVHDYDHSTVIAVVICSFYSEYIKV